MIDRLHDGWTVLGVAEALGVTPKTVHKWRDRFQIESVAGLADPYPAEIETCRSVGQRLS